MTEQFLVEVENLRKVFGGLIAVDGVSMKVRTGSMHAIIGPNGAGKTTLFNLISGVMPLTEGRVFFKGEEITHVTPQGRAHLGIGRSFQITNIFPNLTVLENIRLAAQALGKDNFKFLQPAENLGNTSKKPKKLLALLA